MSRAIVDESSAFNANQMHVPSGNEEFPLSLLAQSGKIDLSKETECVRKALCLEKKGLSQECYNFGKPLKTLKSREMMADHYKTEDCLALEKEKRAKEKKAAEPKFKCYNEGFGIVKRDYSTKAYKGGAKQDFRKEDVDDKEIITKKTKEKQTPTLVINPKKMYVKAVHVLRKKISSQTERTDRKNQYPIPSEPTPIYDDDLIHLTRLCNARWYIDNFNRRKKFNNLHSAIKRNFSSYEHCGQTTHNQQLSRSVVSFTGRDLSASMMLASAKMNSKFGAQKMVNSCRKGDYCNEERKTKKCNKLSTAKVYPHHNIHEDAIKRLQPQYPILPEIDCNEDKQPCPFQHCIDTSMDVEYLRQKMGIKNEGLTQDCNTFGQRINKVQELKELVEAASGSSCCHRHSGGGRSGASDDDGDCNRPKTHCYEEAVGKASQGNKHKNECEVSEDRDQCIITKEERVMRKEEKRYIKAKRDPCEKVQEVCVKEETDKCCKDIKDPCEKKPVCKESLWRRIINFFKARPGCPPPDEWKKKALRDKAERAAKAAGLIVCDPKDLPAEFICKCNSLPNVITPKCEEQKEECEYDEIEDKDQCTSNVKKQNTSRGHKKCSTTTMTSVSKRCYSSKANSKALEEINKSLEEAEKKELAKKIVRTMNQVLNGNDGGEETEVSGNLDPAGGTINNCTETSFNNKSNMFSSNPDMDKERVDLSYRMNSIRKGSTLHFLDVIFHDKAEDELTGYHRAKAFAAFQQYFSKIDTVSDTNHDDIEKAKTEKLLSELDKLLEDTKKKSEKE